MFFYFIIFYIFIFTLKIPRIATFFFPLLFGAVCLRWFMIKVVSEKFLLNFSLLLSFCFTYYLMMLHYDYISSYDAIRNPVYMIGSYALGYSVRRRIVPYWPEGIILVLLSLIAGSTLFSFLSATTTGAQMSFSDWDVRMIPSFWDQNEIIPATCMGAYSSLGLCVLPVIFFIKRGELSNRNLFLFFSSLIALFFFGSVANVVMQNRTPFIAMILSSIAATLLFSAGTDPPRYKVSRVLMAGAVVFTLLLIMRYQVDMSQFMLFKRFHEGGLSTPRYEAWMAIIGRLPDNLVGGRAVYLAGLNYAHNIWLDVLYDTGVVPFIFLVLFHLSHGGALVRIVRAPLPVNLKMTMMGISIAYLATFMVEPAMSFSNMYISASCFFLGLMLSLSDEEISGSLDLSGT